VSINCYHHLVGLEKLLRDDYEVQMISHNVGSRVAAQATTSIVPADAKVHASSFSDLVVPSIERLIDPNVSAVAVAKDLIHATGQSAGAVAADAAVPDRLELLARFVGVDGLLARYGPGRAAAVVTEHVTEKLMTGPIMKGCMAVLERYSSLLSMAISGITALEIGVTVAAVGATTYALYKYFTSPKESAVVKKTSASAPLPTEVAVA
jgi:hypothetical protein